MKRHPGDHGPLAVLLAALAPGVADIKDGRRRGWWPFGMLLSSILLLLSVSGRGTAVLTETFDIGVILLAAGLLSLSMLSSVVLRALGGGRNRLLRALGALAGAGLGLLPGVSAYWLLAPQLKLLESTFVSAGSTTSHTFIEVPRSTGSLDVDLLERWKERSTHATPGERINVLLLGGDAGPGRWSLRTDSINLVSIEPATGDAAMIGIPRNLYGAPMPAGLEKEFPRGFNNLINAVYTWGAANPERVTEVLGTTEEPGASLISAVVSQLTGQPVDAFVLVDMQGFIEVVDALGGVEVYVPKDLPAPGNVPGGKHTVHDMKKGWQLMDGTDALSFSRSRSGDSDYWRMGRQRCMLASLAAQNTAVELVTNWPDLSEAIRGNVTTNLPPYRLLELVNTAQGLSEGSRSLSLTPPLISSTKWDLETIHRLVRETIHPETAVVGAAGTSGKVTDNSAAAGGLDSGKRSGGKESPTKPLTEECRVKP